MFKLVAKDAIVLELEASDVMEAVEFYLNSKLYIYNPKRLVKMETVARAAGESFERFSVTLEEKLPKALTPES